MITTTNSSTVRSRLSPELKVQAESVLASIGMTSSEAIRLFYKQIASRKEFPLELKVPNQTTIGAFNEEHEKVTLNELRGLFK